MDTCFDEASCYVGEAHVARSEGNQQLTNSWQRTEVISLIAHEELNPDHNHVSMKENPFPVKLSDDTPASATPLLQPVTHPEAEDTTKSCLNPRPTDTVGQ